MKNMQSIDEIINPQPIDTQVFQLIEVLQTEDEINYKKSKVWNSIGSFKNMIKDGNNFCILWNKEKDLKTIKKMVEGLGDKK